MNDAFDYIIVGAGSAGCVLTNKLGADTSLSILVVEAGPMDRDIMIHIPAGVYDAWRNPRINWNYATQPEPALSERSVAMPRGKVVGGSSSINSMVYMRGHPCDYDRWSTELSLPSWRYADCLPYFRAGETSDRGSNEWRGGSGELSVSKGSFDNPLFDAFLNASVQAGHELSEDLNGFQPEGFARFDATKRNGRRCSAALAHLKPALKRGNVTLLTNSHVLKLLLDNNKVTGIEIEHQGNKRAIDCKKEVLVSSGAINSPKLLMLSGLGPAAHLRDNGIEPKVDLPGVGQHLQDHPSVIVQYTCTRSFPIHKVNTPLNKARAGLRWVFLKDGIAASNIWEAGGFVRSDDSVSYPNIQYHFGPVAFNYQDVEINLLQGFSLHVDLLRPSSIGHISLKSANPADAPDIHVNYLQTESDIQQMCSGVKKAREIFSQQAFDQWRSEELNPGPNVMGDRALKQWLRASCETDFHPCGTCKMGVGSDCVVDAEFKVHGVENLRIVDASVIPQIVSGNLNAPVQMMAARAADYIMDNKQRTPESATFAFS